jgi:preprotein translocase subunit SecY
MINISMIIIITIVNSYQCRFYKYKNSYNWKKGKCVSAKKEKENIVEIFIFFFIHLCFCWLLVLFVVVFVNK